MAWVNDRNQCIRTLSNLSYLLCLFVIRQHNFWTQTLYLSLYTLLRFGGFFFCFWCASKDGCSYHMSAYSENDPNITHKRLRIFLAVCRHKIMKSFLLQIAYTSVLISSMTISFLYMLRSCDKMLLLQNTRITLQRMRPPPLSFSSLYVRLVRYAQRNNI